MFYLSGFAKEEIAAIDKISIGEMLNEPMQSPKCFWKIIVKQSKSS